MYKLSSSQFSHPTRLLESNALDLNRDVLGELSNGDTAASGLVGEVLLVNSVHLAEILHVREEDL